MKVRAGKAASLEQIYKEERQTDSLKKQLGAKEKLAIQTKEPWKIKRRQRKQRRGTMRKLRLNGASRQSQESYKTILNRRLPTRKRTETKRRIHRSSRNDKVLLRVMRSPPRCSQSQGRERKKNTHSPKKILDLSQLPFSLS